jgi:acyl-coenzyme A synthetase/AMP-(fatty) acid ligase
MTNLRYIICSGEALSPNLVESFVDAFEFNCELINFYESTEVISSRNDLQEKCFDGRTIVLEKQLIICVLKFQIQIKMELEN